MYGLPCHIKLDYHRKPGMFFETDFIVTKFSSRDKITVEGRNGAPGHSRVRDHFSREDSFSKSHRRQIVKIEYDDPHGWNLVVNEQRSGARLVVPLTALLLLYVGEAWPYDGAYTRKFRDKHTLPSYALADKRNTEELKMRDHLFRLRCARCVWPSESERDFTICLYRQYFALVMRAYPRLDLRKWRLVVHCPRDAVQRYALLPQYASETPLALYPLENDCAVEFHGGLCWTQFKSNRIEHRGERVRRETLRNFGILMAFITVYILFYA